MKKPEHTIDEYRQVEGDVWQIFKKYYEDDANLMEYTDDVHKLEKKYEKNLRQYCFMKKVLKVHHDELVELKGLGNIKWG